MHEDAWFRETPCYRPQVPAGVSGSGPHLGSTSPSRIRQHLSELQRRAIGQSAGVVGNGRQSTSVCRYRRGAIGRFATEICHPSRRGRRSPQSVSHLRPIFTASRDFDCETAIWDSRDWSSIGNNWGTSCTGNGTILGAAYWLDFPEPPIQTHGSQMGNISLARSLWFWHCLLPVPPLSLFGGHRPPSARQVPKENPLCDASSHQFS